MKETQMIRRRTEVNTHDKYTLRENEEMGGRHSKSRVSTNIKPGTLDTTQETQEMQREHLNTGNN